MDHELLLLEGGDLLDPIIQDVNIIKARAILDAIGKMDYAAIALGENELAGGLELLLEAGKKHKIPLLNANLFKDKEGEDPIIGRQYLIKKVKGVNVGFTALLESSVARRVIRQSGDKLYLFEYEKIFPKIFKRLKNKSDLQILFYHGKIGVARRIAEEFQDIDLIFVSHGIGSLRNPIKAGDVHIVRYDNRGKFLATIKLKVRDRKVIEEVTQRRHILARDVPDSPGIKPIVRDYLEEKVKYKHTRPSPPPKSKKLKVK